MKKNIRIIGRLDIKNQFLIRGHLEGLRKLVIQMQLLKTITKKI